MTQIKSILDTPIYQKTYQLYGLMYKFRVRISKAHRYTIWQKCEQLNLDILSAIIHAGHTQSSARLDAIYKASENLDLLKTMIRLARETNAIDQTKYLELQNFLQEIGKMIGGWIKAS